MSLSITIAEFLSSIPHWIAIIVIGMLPVSELRGAIPVALGIYEMSVPEAYFFAVIGNMIPVVPLLLYLEPVSNFLRRWRVWDIFFTWLFSKTYHNHSKRFEKYGTLALTIFVAIPLPITGAWTGCAAAFVFGMKTSHAFLAIFIGVLISGLIVTVLTVTGIGLIEII
ncbi:putative membrane protein [Candidatus Methanomarinus sp.]|nr:putative membrane protein [ANME-2 cluster archaeon]